MFKIIFLIASSFIAIIILVVYTFDVKDFSNFNYIVSSIKSFKSIYLPGAFSNTTTLEDVLKNAQSCTKNQDGELIRTKYPPRVNMGTCPPIFGKILIAVFLFKSKKKAYKVAQESLQCYLKSTNYSFVEVDLDSDPRVKNECGKYSVYYRKQCAVSIYIQATDWLLVLDADTGVINPNHCVEEWIDDRVNIVFYERFHNFEIMAGNYLIKNSNFSRNFLRNWAEYEFHHPSAPWHNYDNGALHTHLLKTLRPGAKAEIKACEKFWSKSRSYQTYWGYVTCVKTMLGSATRIWPGKIRILRRGHGFARDNWITNNAWSDSEFMMHAWKEDDYAQSPFEKPFNLTECTNNQAGWRWKKDLKVSVEEERKKLDMFEQDTRQKFPQEARIIPHLSEPEIGECYPNCDIETK